MKKERNRILITLLVPLLCVIATFSAHAAKGQASIDLRLQHLVDKSPTERKSRAVNDSVQVLIDLDLRQIPEQVRVMAQAGGVAVARVAVDDLLSLRNEPGVRAVRSGGKIQLHLDAARPVGNVDKVHQGDELPCQYDGTGVTVGLIDVGFDPHHVAFCEKAGDGTRVRYYIQLTDTDLPNIEASSPAELALITTDDSTMVHATHTTSIAAGGYGGGPYYGIAPNADIMMGAVDLELSNEASILQAAQVLSEKIKESGQPGVLNMSIGSLSSPHDATNLSARFLDAVAEEVPFCISAGNDGHYKRTVCMDFTEEETEKWVLAYGGKGEQYLSFWSEDDREFAVTAYIYPMDKNNELFGPLLVVDRNYDNEVLTIDTDPEGEYYNEDLATYLDSGTLLTTSEVYSENGKYYNDWYFIYEKIPEDENLRIFLAFKIEAKPGMHVDGYAEDKSNIFYRDSKNNIRDWVEPSTDGTISTLALGENLISVGACENDGTVTYYSSWGTYQLPGRNLPLVLAPGGMVAALSRYGVEAEDSSYDFETVIVDGVSYYYGPQFGTSMSSPYVAGVIALWLQADPELTVSEIQEVIAATSVQPDAYFRDAQPERYGAGIIDAYGGLKYILSNLSLGDISVNPSKPLVKVLDGTIEVITASNAPFNATLYCMNGQVARHYPATDSSGLLTTQGVSPGIYVLSVATLSSVYSYKVKL